MDGIQMVDLSKQYQKIKSEIDISMLQVIESTAFINGPQVNLFAEGLANYLNCKHVIPCANGTDALQIALMSCDFEPGDEVIIPAFTYVATAEVIALLRLKPLLIDVDLDNFNINVDQIRQVITSRTKAIVPVHLFGQASNMASIMNLANEYNLIVIEDNAQALGSDFIYPDGMKQKAGTIGHICCTSFFPTKNLGCFGDGGAMMTNDTELATKLTKIANHGQSKKYYHDIIGCNSRLDTIQAAVLNVKLKHLGSYSNARNDVANFYDLHLSHIKEIILPKRVEYSTHVFHQYTIRVLNNKRDDLKYYLEKNDIPSMIYYPMPLNKQEAFMSLVGKKVSLENSEILCTQVLSLPIHTEMTEEQLLYITQKVIGFFN